MSSLLGACHSECVTAPSSPPPTAPTIAAASPAVATPLVGPGQQEALTAWFNAVGTRQSGEEFGDLLARIGSQQLGKPYYDAPWERGPEVLQCDLTSFQCVSFVESTLALGQCIWRGEATTACFMRALRDIRYRHGVIQGYPSRLHYFEEWLLDNDRRGHVQIITGALGGKRHPMQFFFMTHHPDLYPALADPNVRAAIAATEAILSHSNFDVLDRDQVGAAEPKMQSGDVIAITTRTPGILVSHTGLINRDLRGIAHFMHASSLHKQVVITDKDLADFVLHGRGHSGVLVARPIPPP